MKNNRYWPRYNSVIPEYWYVGIHVTHTFTYSHQYVKHFHDCQFSSVAQSCPTLCNPMNRSTPGLPVHHQLLEFTQIRVPSWIVLWRPTRPFRSDTQKRCPFHYRGLECKSRKSRNTWSNRQIWPWNTEWSRATTSRVLPRKCTGHSKHPLPTTHEKTLHMDITRWSIPKSYWLYSLQQKMEKLSIQSTKTRPGADCGSGHELLIAKFRL